MHNPPPTHHLHMHVHSTTYTLPSTIYRLLACTYLLSMHCLLLTHHPHMHTHSATYVCMPTVHILPIAHPHSLHTHAYTTYLHTWPLLIHCPSPTIHTLPTTFPHYLHVHACHPSMYVHRPFVYAHTYTHLYTAHLLHVHPLSTYHLLLIYCSCIHILTTYLCTCLSSTHYPLSTHTHAYSILPLP